MRGILPAVVLMISLLHSAQADEKPTFYGKTVDDWIAVLRDKTVPTVQRGRAAYALRCFGPDAKAAVPDLLEAVRQNQFKTAAIEALIEIGAGTEVTVPYMVHVSFEKECVPANFMGTWIGSNEAKRSLVRIGTPAVPTLLEVLNGKDLDKRACAIEVLGDMGPSAKDAVPALICAIEGRNQGDDAQILCDRAVVALAKIGPDARPAAPALMDLMENGSSRLWDYVVVALDRMGCSPARKLAEAFIREKDPDDSEFGWYNLRALGPPRATRFPHCDGLSLTSVGKFGSMRHSPFR